MPPKQPILGSAAMQSPSSNAQTVQVSPTTCQDLSLFKDLMKEYRKLDDTITMRLNRATAQFRDRDREGLGGKGNIQDQACAYLWKDLVENWKRRTEIVEYCVGVVDQGMEQKRRAMESEEAPDPARQRRIKGALYAEEVKRNMMKNELTVEQIIRHRSLEAFRSRCKYFEPPLSDIEARRWWDSAQSNR